MASNVFEARPPTPVFLDVDTGVDDAFALLLALRSPALKVVGVSCVAGNTDVDTVVAATMRVLDAAEAPLDLPVARGFCELESFGANLYHRSIVFTATYHPAAPLSHQPTAPPRTT